MDEKGGIGWKNRLPWRLSNDLRQFKAITMGHHLIMGRKTYQSVGRPLPGRRTIIITRDPAFVAEGCDVVNSLETALDLASRREEEEAFVTGGGEIFEQALPVAGRIYLTRVHTQVQADIFFPPFNPQAWNEIVVTCQRADENNQYPFTISILERKPT